MKILIKTQTRVLKVFSKLISYKLKLMGAKIGSGFLIFRSSRFYRVENLKIGNRVFINDFFWCNSKGGVEIGDDVIIGPRVLIHSANHNFSRPEIPFREQGHTNKKVIICDNVWLGANVTILPGIEICSNVIVAAGSVVTKSLTEEGVYAGIPAKYIKKL